MTDQTDAQAALSERLRQSAPTIARGDQTSSYHVLRRTLTSTVDDQTWELVGETVARDSKHAIRQAAEKEHGGQISGDSTATYVAIPARSWAPVTVTAKVETVVKLEGL